ncbi:MAG: serine protease [bacterium]|nr:serine protease [bacterium]
MAGFVLAQVTKAQTECTPFIYSDWSVCSVDAKQTRTVSSLGPETCTGGDPVISQACKRPLPKITSISPSAINYIQTAPVEIIGEYFGTSQGSSRVFGPNNRGQTTGTWTDTKILVYPSNFEDPRNFYLVIERSHSSETSPVRSNAFPLKIIPWGPPKITSVTRKIVTSQGTEVWIHGENFGMPGNPDVSVSNARVYETNGTSHKIVLREHDVIRVLVNLDDLKRPYGKTSFYVKVKCLDDECSSAVDGPDGKDYISNSFSVDVASTPPPCTTDIWSCGDWNTCSLEGKQSRSCTKTFDCSDVDTPSPSVAQVCTYTPPPCISWTYSAWSTCSVNGQQTRPITSASPNGCTGGNPILNQSCTPPPKPIIPIQPTCDADTWTCDDWNSCSLSGIQNRSCRKTFDCSSVETAPPTTDQYCEAPNRPTQQIPQNSSDEISNQDAIIKSTVKLLCPVDAKRASQGSGTIIDSNGTILTNKHVIAGTLGCLVGFINDFNDEPYFGDRHIADITKISPNQDIAILKIRNPQNKNLTSVDITKSSSNLRLGTKVTTYGFPAKFGTKVTYTSGDFSGTDGSYIKTTAILEYGNSGGGAYLKDGTFIGIPSAVVKGELNALGYILSINTINSWLGNSGITYSGTSNNSYSRVSILEDIDLKKLGSLKLFIPDTDTKGNLAVPTTNQNIQKTTEQPKTNQIQKESIVIEPADKNQKINSKQNNLKPSESVQKIKELPKRLFRWLRNLF